MQIDIRYGENSDLRSRWHRNSGQKSKLLQLMIAFIYGMCEKCAIKYARVWSVRRTFFKACALFEPETWHVRTSVFTNYFPIIAICTNIYSILLRTKYYHLFFSNLSLTICMCASEYEKRAKKRIQKPNGFSRRKKAMISWQKWYFVS